MNARGSSSIHAFSIQTPIFRRGDDLQSFIVAELKALAQPPAFLEGKVIAITSKLLSIAENRFVARDIPKKDLILREADHFICETSYGVSLTIKDGLLIPSAGIDESNSETGEYLLYPERPFESARKIGEGLRASFGVKHLGVILTDSHTHPLRRGVTGIALAHWGFRAIRSLVGEEDLFGRKLKMTSVNVVDSLAVAAVFTMGESKECSPLALVESTGIEFTQETDPSEIQIPLAEDLYGPLLQPNKR